MQTVPFGKLGFEVSRLGFGMMRHPLWRGRGQACDRPGGIGSAPRDRRGISYGHRHGYHDGERSSPAWAQAATRGQADRKLLMAGQQYADMDGLLDEH